MPFKNELGFFFIIWGFWIKNLDDVVLTRFRLKIDHFKEFVYLLLKTIIFKDKNIKY